VGVEYPNAYLIAALAHSGRIAEARAALAQFDPRQAGVLKTSQFGPKLTRIIDEALRLVDSRNSRTDGTVIGV
jgi:hypothetical protein